MNKNNNVKRIDKCIKCLNILKEKIMQNRNTQEQLARIMKSNSELLEISLDLWKLEQELIAKQEYMKGTNNATTTK